MTRISEANETPTACTAGEAGGEIQWYESRAAQLGTGLTIRRALPLRHRRMIGAWCFLDHFGPHTFEARQDAMWVGPHPHIGLQTVTWLLDGEVTHRDSLGSEMLIRPGQLNVMTAGSGISHTEETPDQHGDRLHGVQFWVALPDHARNVAPSFEHHENLPEVTVDDARLQLFYGSGFGATSSATVHTPIVGAQLDLDGVVHLPLESTWEHGIVSLTGPIQIGRRTLAPGELAYVPPGTSGVGLRSSRRQQVIVVGGEPFGETILLWWNFVARTHEEIAEATRLWNRGEGFGEVHGFAGDRLEAPSLKNVRL